jgi:hypothetical protein
MFSKSIFSEEVVKMPKKSLSFASMFSRSISSELKTKMPLLLPVATVSMRVVLEPSISMPAPRVAED